MAAPSPASTDIAPTRPHRWLSSAVVLWYLLALVLAFPPFGLKWGVLFFLVPFVAWARTAPAWRDFMGAALGASWVAWFLILIWLRHIYPPWGWVALAALSAEAAIFPTAWMLALRWAGPRMATASPGRALLGVFALAGWWVVLDWTRSWLFSGYLWLPLSAAFWHDPLFLQPAAWTGQAGVTFLVVALNLGLGCGLHFLSSQKNETRGMRLRVALGRPEIYAPILLFCAVFLVWSPLYLFPRLANRQTQAAPLLTAGVVQPWTPADTKWSAERANLNWQVLQDLTLSLRNQDLDVVVWPEAAPPFAVQGPGTEDARDHLQKLVDAEGKPLLFGAVAFGETSSTVAEPARRLYNALFIMNPLGGLEKTFYAKRKLVPFGEFVPYRTWFPALGKVVPLDDTSPGIWDSLLSLTLTNGRKLAVGPLICYEDIFPQLARAETAKGADFFVVVTNDAWYGTEGGATQHATHSVLRAVENRRPLLRCGNDGWSGWIDEFGFARALEQAGGPTGNISLDPASGEDLTTYFRGVGVFKMYRDRDYDGVESFYVRHGDWFVALSAVLAAAGLVVLRKQ